jgi:glucose-6-phosphate isomerase
VRQDLEGLGPLRQPVEAALERMRSEDWVGRLWRHDETLWGPGSAEWLGWLEVADGLLDDLSQFEELRGDLREAGFSRAVLAGMGGSSLCPDVLRNTFGVRGGGLDLGVLDSTDPSTIAYIDENSDPSQTAYIVASKSGGTTETISHFRHFHGRLASLDPPTAGRHFLAITDEGSSLQALAEEHDFNSVFLNPADIGGRYSALSYFGVVPAAVMGLDVARLLEGARAMGASCRAEEPAPNPGAVLGAVLGEAARNGRDKVTLVCSPDVATFGTWLEQLLAESTGKHGKGIIPVEGEPLGAPGVYGDDRLFVQVRSAVSSGEDEAALVALRTAGHPVFTIEMKHPMDLGGEFLRWEVATAIAGAILEINPFDQPNVQESKDNTKAALQRFQEMADFGVETGPGDPTVLEGLLESLAPGDYFAVLAYTQPTSDVGGQLELLRRAVRDRFKVATTVGYGPRYLHSTGQLHKGGPNTGVFLVLSDSRTLDIPIPGSDYGFKTLIGAQWAGDLKSLRDHGRRAGWVRLEGDRLATLRRLTDIATG